MKLALFSRHISPQAVRQLSDWTHTPPPRTRLCYITTAANVYSPEPEWLTDTQKQLESYGFQVSRFDLVHAHRQHIDLSSHFQDIDIIFISGGNVFYLMHWIYQTKFDRIIHAHLSNDKVYAGSSAGAVCLVSDLVPMAKADKPELAPSRVDAGLGLLDFAPIPHWQSPKYQPILESIVADYHQTGTKTIPFTDDQALFVDTIPNTITIYGQ